ncbi:MAG: sodium-dependent transporter [Simkaniaceae bacterium]|nr:sodium-dependent transporter [Simkaniaceae bacterium]
MAVQREHWASRLGFIMAAAGSAIGLGSFWRFPYVVGQNGGGAFVICYILFTIIIGIPVFCAELGIGRYAQKGAIRTYESLTSPESNWKMLGWLNVITCFIILGYYSYISGWCLSYVLSSITQFAANKTPDQIKGVFDVLATSPSVMIFWLIMFILLNIGVVHSGVRKGIEHWSRILMPGFFVILILLFCYSLTLSGFKEAVYFTFYPDWAKLTPQAILNALGMAFFTLSVGIGIILTYGSYMKSDQDIPKMGFTVAGMTMIVSFLAALTIFPIVFTYNFPAQGGPGLLFKTMPVLFQHLPGSLVISTAFFALLLFAALTSTISLFEVLVSNLIEIFGIARKRATIITGGFAFIIGGACALSAGGILFPNWEVIYGKDFFLTLDYLCVGWLMPIGGLLTTIFVGWILDKNIFKTEFLKGTKMPWLYHIVFFSIKFLAPLVVIIIILQEAGIIDVTALIHGG